MKYVFLVGSLFSGSTIIGNILNTNSSCFHAGEVDRLRIFSRYPDNEDYYVDGCMLCGLHEEINCPVWSDLPSPPTNDEELVDVYKKLTVRSKKSIIIDGSKNVDWVSTLVDHGLKEVSAILLSRDPFAFSYSYHKATGAPCASGLEVWKNVYNHSIRSLLHRGIPFISMKHADMIQNSEGFFSKILKFIGADNNIDISRYINFENHAIGGNVGPFLNYKLFSEKQYISREHDQNRPADQTEIKEKNMEPTLPSKWQDTKWLQHTTLQDIDAGLSIPGILDVMSLLGYSPASLIEKKLLN